MKKVLIKSLCAIFLASMSAASCQMLNPGPLPEDIVGDTPGELQAKIGDILAQAGTDSTKVEFAEITTSFIYKPGDHIANVKIQIVSPSDKNKMEEYLWTDMKDRRNMCEKFDLIVSTRLESDLIDTYEGYKENAYIDNFTISKDDMYISVKHKDGNISKTYRISPDGSGIVIPQ